VKCPTCGVWSSILETRELIEGLRRRRECANHHRFTTYETVVVDKSRKGGHGKKELIIADLKEGLLSMVAIAEKHGVNRRAVTYVKECLVLATLKEGK
jgi:transcriptional regulator NrdR family protein